MMSKSKEPIGLTRGSGWQIGLRRTLAVPAALLWDWMLSREGLELWLGSGPEFPFQAGGEYLLDDGTTGMVRVFQSSSHWRISRQPIDPKYKRASLIQVRILESGENSVLAFHEEHLPTESERHIRKAFYLAVMEKIKERFGAT